MIGGLSQGLTREAAARFAFLIGVPAIAGAGLLAVKDMLEASTSPDFVHLGIGFISSFISGYIAIDFLIRFLQKRSLTVFVVYRVILGLILLAL